MSIKNWIKLGLFTGFCLWSGIWLFFAKDPYVLNAFAPRFDTLALFVVAGLAVLTIRSNIVQIFMSLWLLWPVAGTYFSIGHFIQKKLWAPLYFADANVLYMTNVTAMILAAAASQFLLRPYSPSQYPKLQSSVQFFPILIFPLVYAATLFLTGPTLLSGTNISDQMYGIDRGPVYSMRIALVMFFAYCGLRLFNPNEKQRGLWIAAIAGGLLVSVLDGKRDMAILGVLTILFTYVTYYGDRKSLKPVLMGIGVVALYGLIANLRSDKTVEIESWVSIATLAGVEYRDYVHSIVYWSPEWIETLGYDFWRSTAAALINSTVLEAFGIDKNTWITMDSARTWQSAFQQNVGIRVGLVAELHFQVAAYSHIFFAVLGVAVVWLDKIIKSTTGQNKLIISVLALANAQIAMFSQSTMTFGFVLTTIYLMIGLSIWNVAISMLASRIGQAQPPISP